VTIDPVAAIEAGRQFQRLYESATEVQAALRAIEVARTQEARQKAAFDLAMSHGAIRAVGYVSRWGPEDRARWLATLLPDEGARAFATALIEQAGRAPLRHALTAAMPGSFPVPDGPAWSALRERLRAKPDEKIWGDPEGVALRGLWVTPLCTHHKGPRPRHDRTFLALREKKPRAETPVEDVLAAVEAFALKPHAPNVALVVSAAGLGKSSFSIMLADRLARHPEVSPVLVRLRDIDPARPLLSEIEHVSRRDGVVFAEGLRAARDLVLVLDGFDELGDSAHGSPGLFLMRLRDLVRDGLVHAAVITGRDTLLRDEDGAIPEGTDIYTLLPFDPPRVKRWGKNWERVTGYPFDTARFTRRSKDVGEDPLREVASHPLMLYMLARMEASGEGVDGETFEDRAKVYRRILDWSCQRHQDLRPGDPWKAAQMRRFLRAAGYASVVRGREVLRLGDLKDAIEALNLAADGDASRFAAMHTLLSFTRRGAEDQTWEFTHRSFGEFLAAEWLASRVLGLIERKKNPLDPEETWRLDASEATREWMAAFGTVLIPENVERYLLWLLRDADGTSLKLLRTRLGDVYRALVEETEAEEAVRVARAWGVYPSQVRGFALANLFLLGGVEERFRPEEVHKGRFIAAVHAIRAVLEGGQDTRIYSRVGIQGIENKSVRKTSAWTHVALPGLDASGCDLRGINLYGAWLDGVDLRGANLAGATLWGACLFGVNAAGANFASAGLVDSITLESNFDAAILCETDLRSARLQDSTMRGADLRGATVDALHADGVDVTGARLPKSIASKALLFRVRTSTPKESATTPTPRKRRG
jgi:hypothetical protein